MDICLELFLQDFIPRNTTIENDHYSSEKVDFLILDLDLDEEAEILILFKQQGEEYLGVLKHRGSFWRLFDIFPLEDDEAMLGDFLNPIVNDRLTLDHLGQSYRVEDLFQQDCYRVVCLEGKRSCCLKIIRSSLRSEQDLEVVDFKRADIFGNGREDEVYLLGTRVFGSTSPQVNNLTLRVVDSCKGEETEMKMPIESAYGPRLIIEDFTGDLKKDIMVMSYTDPGGYVYADIYTIENDELKHIFSTSLYNEEYTGLVEYKDQYRIEVSTDIPGKLYVLDISHVPPEILDMFYDQQGKLKEPTEGTLMGAVSVNVVDYDRDGVYDMAVVQRLSGADQQDNLGLVETFLRWNIGAGAFVPYAQYVSIYGQIKQ